MSSTRGGWLSSLRRHGRGRRASGPALKAVMRARRVGGPALKAELTLISSAKTHAARRHAKGMICAGGQCVLAAYRITGSVRACLAMHQGAEDATRTPTTRLFCSLAAIQSKLILRELASVTY